MYFLSLGLYVILYPFESLVYFALVHVVTLLPGSTDSSVGKASDS